MSYSLSYIFIPKNTGKNLNWSIKQKIKILSMYGQKKKNDHWLTQSCTGWLFVLKRFELSVGYSLLPHQLQVHTPPPSGMPFNTSIVIKEDHCQPYWKVNYRVKTLLIGNRKTILLKWIIAVSFKFWFHRLHVLSQVTKIASLKMKFSCYGTKNTLYFSREAVFSQQLPNR